MIANANELEVAFRDLKIFDKTLEGLRQELLETNPGLFPVVAQGYLRRIQDLQSDVFAYLRENPADAPFKVRLAGPEVPQGSIRANVIARLLRALQGALYSVGSSVSTRMNDDAKESSAKALREALGLNLVATQRGSFILALDLMPRTRSLFDYYNLAEQTVMQLLDYLTAVPRTDNKVPVSKRILNSLDQIAAIINPNKIETIEFAYRSDVEERSVIVNAQYKEALGVLLNRVLQGEETVVGTLFSIDIERNVCRLRPEGESSVVECTYVEEIEDDLIAVVKRDIQVSGEIEDVTGSDRRRIRNIERFTTVGDEDE